MSDKDGEAGNEPGNPEDTSNLGSWEVSFIGGMLSLRGLHAMCTRRGNSGLELHKSLLVPLTYRVAKVIKSQGGPRRGETDGVTGLRVNSEAQVEGEEPLGPPFLQL